MGGTYLTFMRIPPFYTIWQNDPIRDVWHNTDTCPIGREIPLAKRLFGTDHIREYCSHCAQLNKSELPTRIAP
jgi:hypothetical protein